MLVTTHDLCFLTTAGVVLSGLVSTGGYYYYRVRRSFQVRCEDLLKKLTWIDRDCIAQVALYLANPSGLPREAEDAACMQPSQLWQLIGGLKGLEVLETNGEVLIELACYIQRWYPEASVVAERLRLDARALKWHVDRLKGAAQTGNLQISFPFYARRAVGIYYLMTRRVLDLYEAGNFSMLADLQRAL